YLTKPYTREELLRVVHTRLKKSDEIKERHEESLNELRERIIRHLPHELRTPLNGIIGYGQLLMDFPDSVSHQELSGVGRTIFESGMRLLRLIQNYLLYIQLITDQRDEVIDYQLNQPEQLCRDKVMEIASRYQRIQDLVLKTEHCKVALRESDFLKIVEEIADNAFKFSPSGTPVRITCKMMDGKFHLNVEDSGRGISAADIQRIGAYMQFDRDFYEQQGSGLGLIIVKKLVELYKGELQINSKQGIGTQITLSLPA
ncbi:MAG: HAMP domain-containing histidine kinase, partial [Marinilabiliales bacterium]|nr:HAMP domain-containing histidine kinase [Marinilabiliales bacterium]